VLTQGVCKSHRPVLSGPTGTAAAGTTARHAVIRLLLIGVMAITCLLTPWPSAAAVRIKDIVSFEGVRDNLLVGYGLVVGLDGSGDSLRNSPFTEQSLVGMLERLGVNTRTHQIGSQTLSNIRTDNVAAVMVTATLPPYAAQGTRIDVNVSSLGDADSLRGGTLLVTPLVGADGEVYAVGQGPVMVAGFTAQGQGQTVTQNVPTSGRIPSGAIVEREIPFSMAELVVLRLALRNPDFTTAKRIADRINRQLGANAALANNPSTVLLNVPANRRRDIVGLVTEIERLTVEPDQVARVVIDERSGIIVMGQNVRISTVAVAQGNLTVSITETPQVSQPNAFAQGGQTAVVPRTNIQVDDQSERRLAMIPEQVSLEELVRNLNALGVGPRDMISILQAIKAAGALQAEIEIF